MRSDTICIFLIFCYIFQTMSIIIEHTVRNSPKRVPLKHFRCLHYLRCVGYSRSITQPTTNIVFAE